MENENALLPGSVLRGNAYTYTIQKILGQGSFGITYLATTKVKVSGPLGELETSVQVAIKEFFMRDINGRIGDTVTCSNRNGIYVNYKRKFAIEAKNLSKLKHPHIVQVLEAFEANGTVYYSMEYLDGGSFDQQIHDSERLSDKEALQEIMQIGEALSFMHQHKMLHLDMKPVNIMRRKNGDLVLIDFGLSKQFQENGEPESSTRIGLGTRGYAPLEQADYKRENGFTPTLDIYALGATLFKALTGTTPPDASIVFNEGFPADEMHRLGIGEALVQLTSWAMQPMKSKRPQTVEEFMAKARRILPRASDKLPPRVHINRVYTPTYEKCNGMQIRWAEGLSESRKKIIRKLLKKMKRIGSKDQIVYGEYGPEVVATHPLMSLGDETWHYVSPLVEEDITTDGYPRNTTSLAITAILQLEEYTGLPFRMATREEMRFVHTEIPPVEEYHLLSYSFRDGLQFSQKDIGICGFTTHDYISLVRFQLVCDRPTPIYNDKGFDVPCTQEIKDEVSPIGFSLYKTRVGDAWNITSPESPMYSLLPDSYDSISNINIFSIPGPGSPNLYLGIEATKGDRTYYYEFSKMNHFKLLGSFSKDEIEVREAWT